MRHLGFNKTRSIHMHTLRIASWFSLRPFNASFHYSPGLVYLIQALVNLKYEKGRRCHARFVFSMFAPWERNNKIKKSLRSCYSFGRLAHLKCIETNTLISEMQHFFVYVFQTTLPPGKDADFSLALGRRRPCKNSNALVYLIQALVNLDQTTLFCFNNWNKLNP